MNLEAMLEWGIALIAVFIGLTGLAMCGATVDEWATNWWRRRKERKRRATVHFIRTGRPL